MTIYLIIGTIIGLCFGTYAYKTHWNDYDRRAEFWYTFFLCLIMWPAILLIKLTDTLTTL